MSDDRTRNGPPSPIEGMSADAERTPILASPPRTPDRPAIRIGEVLGHTYRIEAFLAMGGMGAVYRARHVILDTEHAIKIIRAELARRAADRRVAQSRSQGPEQGQERGRRRVSGALPR